jgi:hypothetical protein
MAGDVVRIIAHRPCDNRRFLRPGRRVAHPGLAELCKPPPDAAFTLNVQMPAMTQMANAADREMPS